VVRGSAGGSIKLCEFAQVELHVDDRAQRWSEWPVISTVHRCLHSHDIPLYADTTPAAIMVAMTPSMSNTAAVTITVSAISVMPFPLLPPSQSSDATERAEYDRPGGVGIPTARQPKSPARSLLPERPVPILLLVANNLVFGARRVVRVVTER
jgi:hypothetical protein